MTDEQRAAAVFAQAVYVMGEIEGMKAENHVKFMRQEFPAHDGSDFERAIGKIRGDIIHSFLVGNLDGLL